MGCSIEISRDIYMYVGLSMGNPLQKIRMQKMRGRNYVAQTRTCSKSVLESKQSFRNRRTEERKAGCGARFARPIIYLEIEVIQGYSVHVV